MNFSKMLNRNSLLSFSKISFKSVLIILAFSISINAQEKHSNEEQWKSVGGQIIVSGAQNFTNSLSINKGKITVRGPGNIAKFQRRSKSTAVRVGLKSTKSDMDFNTAWLGGQDLLHDQGKWNWYDDDIKDFNPTIHNGGGIPADSVITLDIWASNHEKSSTTVGIEYEFWFFPKEGGKIIKVIEYGPNGEEIDVTPGKTVKDKITGIAGRVIKGKVFDVVSGRYLIPGDRVSIDQFLETHDNEALIIIDYLDAETKIKMKKKTKIKIVKKIKKTNKSGVSLVFGRLWSLFNNRHKGEYAVETMNSVAGVEGTEFETAFDAVKGKTTVTVWDGTVSLKCKNNNAPPTMVNAGMQATMDNNCNQTVAILSSDNNTASKAGWDLNIQSDYSNAVGKPCAPDKEFVLSLYHSVVEYDLEVSFATGYGGAHMHSLRDGNSRLVTILSFFNSPGYLDKQKNNHEFMRDAYQAVLGREPNTTEINQWSRIARNDIIKQLFNSHEYKNLMASCPEIGQKTVGSSSIAGQWSINQHNGYNGTIDLHQDHLGLITGSAIWNQYGNGTINGQIVGNNVEFTINYPNGDYGFYKGALAHNGTKIINGIHNAKNGATASWDALRSSGNINVEGQWYINQYNGYNGTINLQQDVSGRIVGTAKWNQYENGAIEGKISGNAIEFKISYPNGDYGFYKGTLLQNGTKIVNGTVNAKNGASPNWDATR